VGSFTVPLYTAVGSNQNNKLTTDECSVAKVRTTTRDVRSGIRCMSNLISRESKLRNVNLVSNGCEQTLDR